MNKKLEWLKKHKIVSIVFAVVVVVVVANLRIRSKMAENGMLSQPVQKGTILESVYGIGTVVATRSYSLKTGVTSTVTKLHVKEGDSVRRGQKLIDLEGTDPIVAPFDGTVTYLPVK